MNAHSAIIRLVERSQRPSADGVRFRRMLRRAVGGDRGHAVTVVAPAQHLVGDLATIDVPVDVPDDSSPGSNRTTRWGWQECLRRSAAELVRSDGVQPALDDPASAASPSLGKQARRLVHP